MASAETGAGAAESGSSRIAAGLRLAAVVAAAALAAVGYRDHFLVGALPWWRWVGAFLAAAALLVVAFPGEARPPEVRWRRLLRGLCGVAAAFAWFAALQLVPERGREAQAAVAVVAGIVLVACARWVPFAPAAVARVLAPAAPAMRGQRSGWVLALAGVAASAAAVGWNDHDHLVAFVLWLAGIVLFALGVRIAGGPPVAAPPTPPDGEAGPALSPATERMFFVLVLALGACFRLVALGDVPTWIDADEGRLATWGLGIWKEGFPDAFAFGWNSFPHLTYMLHVTGVQLLGYANVHLRLVSALLGIATLVPAWYFARRWWGPFVALLAMALLAVNQEHVYWSRVGFNNVDAVLVAALLLAAFARALQGARTVDWVLVGIVGGLGFHTYHAAKFFPVLLGIAFVVIALGARGTLRTHLRGIVAAGVAFVLTLGPQFVSLQRQWVTFRIDTTNRNNVHLAVDAWLGGNIDGLRDHVYRQVVDCLYVFLSLPWKMPILDAATAAPFVAGMLWLFWRWRDPRHVLVLVWICGILVAGGMMTDFPPSKQRMVGFLPVVCLVPAILAGRARGLLHAALGRRAGPVVFVLTVVWLVLAAWNSRETHFVYQAERMRGDVMTNVCRRMLAAERPFTIYTIGATSITNPHMLERDCTLGPDPGRIVVNPAADHAAVPLPAEHRGGAIFTIPAEHRELVARIRSFYPEAKFEIVRGASGSEDVYFVTLTRPEVESTRGLALRYRDGGGEWRIGPPPPAYPPPDFVYRLQAPADAAPGSRAQWRGQVWVPAGGAYRFRVVGGDVQLRGGPADAAGVLLVEGWHPLQVELPVGGEGDGPVLEWRRPGATTWSAVPREHLFDRSAAPALLGRYFAAAVDAAGAAPVALPAQHERLEGALAFEWRLYDDGEMPPWFAPRPSTMEWHGTVDLGADGGAVLRLDASAPTEVYVAGRLVVAAGGANQPPVDRVLAEETGVVPILVRTRRPADDNVEYWKLRLLWRTDGGGWTAVGAYAPPLTPAPSDPAGRAGDPRGS